MTSRVAPVPREPRRSDPPARGGAGLQGRASTAALHGQQAAGVRQPMRAVAVSAYAGTGENYAPASGSLSTCIARQMRLAAPYPSAGASALCPGGVRSVGAPLRDITNTAVAVAVPGAAPRVQQRANPAAPATAAQPPAPSVDAEAENNATVVEYMPDICDQLFARERSGMCQPTYMDGQKGNLNGKMRAILVDWLVDVHARYRMRKETLFLTVNLIDRYLSRAVVERKRLQLVGVVALFIAAKFEEIDPPTAASLAFITDNSYTEAEIFAVECSMLAALNFDILVPTVASFLDSVQSANHSDPSARELAHYILELGLLDMKALRHQPSKLVAAAVLLSNEIVGQRPMWPAAMQRASRCSAASLKGCVDEFRTLLSAATHNPLKAVQLKYASTQHHRVARRSYSFA